MKILHLTVTKQWFDLMVNGTKRIEYREMKVYWNERLTKKDKWYDINDPERYIKFDEIHIKNGYQKNAPFFRVAHLKTDSTPPKLIMHNEGTMLHLKTSCYQLHLGKILEIKNYNL